MASAIATNLRIYAERLENPDPANAAADVRTAARFLRIAADQLDKHLKTMRMYRQRLKGAPPYTRPKKDWP